jgi:hypothetical protein
MACRECLLEMAAVFEYDRLHLGRTQCDAEWVLLRRLAERAKPRLVVEPAMVNESEGK